MKKYILCLVVLCSLAGNRLHAQGFTYTVNYQNYTTQAQAAFDFAVQRWSFLLYTPIQIKINTYYFTYPGGPLGITFSNARKDFIGAPMDSTMYPTTLANFLANTELNPGEYDMDIYVNGAFNWYFGTDGNTPAGQYDFASVIAHEIGHALGFTSVAKKTGSSGSMGMLQQSDFAPVNPSFPWPEQDSMPGIYDRFIENNAGARLDTFANPSTALGSQLTSNQLFFNGPLSVAANGGVRPRLHAPTTFELGTSILHLNETTYPNGHVEELMTPYISAGNAEAIPGPVTLAMLQDMGWQLHTGISEANTVKKPMFHLYPVPVQNELLINSTANSAEAWDVQVFSSEGKMCISQQQMRSGMALDVSMLTAGMYVMHITYPGGVYHTRFCKQ